MESLARVGYLSTTDELLALVCDKIRGIKWMTN